MWGQKSFLLFSDTFLNFISGPNILCKTIQQRVQADKQTIRRTDTHFVFIVIYSATMSLFKNYLY